MPGLTLPNTAGSSVRPARFWQRHLCLFGPVALCTGAGLALALRAMPLAGGARLLFAVAISLNVWLLALSSWSSVLGLVLRVRSQRPPG